MNKQDCPVTVDALRKQLRLPEGVYEEQLDQCLTAAAEWVESYSGVEFSRYPVFPEMLRSAILMYAAYLFENPVDGVSERYTAAMRLADPLIWQTRITKLESSQNM